MKLDLSDAELKQLEREIVSAFLEAGTKSVHAATRWLEREFEGLTRSAVTGRAWRAWKSAVYPKGGGPAYEPVGEVFGNGGQRTKGMLNYWTQPGVNRARNGKYLAVPLPGALATPRGRNISPREWEGRFGVQLRFLARPGKAPLLVADIAQDKVGRAMGREKAAAKRRGGQQVSQTRTVAVFVLLDMQQHANRVALGLAIPRARDRMVEEFSRRVGRYGRGA